jgi:ArsR family transcriptional regulator
MALRGGELCVCQIIELLELAPSTVSKHMAVLRQAGLVKKRKVGRWMHYRLPTPGEMALPVKSTLAWVFNALDRDKLIEEDRRTLQRIIRQDPVKLCSRQRSR